MGFCYLLGRPSVVFEKRTDSQALYVESTSETTFIRYDARLVGGSSVSSRPLMHTMRMPTTSGRPIVG
jgi:hypothetical protein